MTSTQLTTSLSQRYQKPNLLKTFFLIFNGLAYTACLATILAFSLKTTDQEEADGRLNTFYRVVSGINGLCFFLLTATLLNYGSRLEKIVHAIKMKGLAQQVRQPSDYHKYGGQSNSSPNVTLNLASNADSA